MGESMFLLKKMVEKLTVSILSSFILSLIMAMYHTPTQNDQLFSPTFEDIFIVVFVVSLIIFVVGGIPASIFIDGVMKKWNFSHRVYRYLCHMALYILAGVLVGSIFSLLLTGKIDRFIFFGS